MKIALDVNCGYLCIPLIRAGYHVVHVAIQHENDENWLNVALERSADTFLSQDVDVKNFAMNRGLLFIYMNPTKSKDEHIDLILYKLRNVVNGMVKI